jgi:hypothetical protein
MRRPFGRNIRQASGIGTWRGRHGGILPDGCPLCSEVQADCSQCGRKDWYSEVRWRIPYAFGLPCEWGIQGKAVEDRLRTKYEVQ